MKNLNKNSIVALVVALVIAAMSILAIYQVAKNQAAYLTQNEGIGTKIENALGAFSTKGASEQGTFRLYTALAATTTTASSTPINIAGAKKVTLFFSRGDTTGQGNSGSSAFSVTVSGDDSNYVQYNKLIDNVTNTNAQTLTRVGSVSLAAGTSTKTYSMDLDRDGFIGMKCGVIETTDGEHTCKVLVQY